MSNPVFSPLLSERPPHDADAAFHRDALQELTLAGLAVTRAIRVQAEALSEGSDAGSADRVRDVERMAAAFERVSRAVRYCLAQAQRLEQPGRVRETLYGPGRKPARELTGADLATLSDDELRELSAAARARCEREDRERAERQEAAEDLMVDRPIEEVLAVILRDLELAVLAVEDDGDSAELQEVRQHVERLTAGVLARMDPAAAVTCSSRGRGETPFRDTG